jgi:hypothetical protein
MREKCREKEVPRRWDKKEKVRRKRGRSRHESWRRKRRFSPIIGEIENMIEEIIPVEENETPQIKENCLEASGTSPESPIPQVSSIQEVSLILPSHASSVPVQLISQSQPGSASTGRILGSLGRSQAGPLGFILIGTTRSTMVGHAGGLIA